MLSNYFILIVVHSTTRYLTCILVTCECITFHNSASVALNEQTANHPHFHLSYVLCMSYLQPTTSALWKTPHQHQREHLEYQFQIEFELHLNKTPLRLHVYDNSCSKCINQLAQLQQLVDSNSNSSTIDSTPQSREYWTCRIDVSIQYPGEDSTKTAKRAYKQRLDLYLTKSPPIWDLVSGKDKCPITLDMQVIQFFKSKFGDLWTFDPKDINRWLSHRTSP